MLRIFLLGFLLTYHHTEAGKVCEKKVNGTGLERAAKFVKKLAPKNKKLDVSLCEVVDLKKMVNSMVTDGRFLMCVTTLQAILEKYKTEYKKIVNVCKTGDVLKDLKCHDGDKLETCMETMPKEWLKKTTCDMCKDGHVSWYENCYKKVTCNEFVRKAKKLVQQGCDACQTTTSKPATGKPATGKPATGKPATGKPATGKPTTGKPATGKPATGKPATEKNEKPSTTNEKPSSKPTTGKPATEKNEKPSKPKDPKNNGKSGGVALVPYSFYLRALAVLPFFWEIIHIVQKSI